MRSRPLSSCAEALSRGPYSFLSVLFPPAAAALSGPLLYLWGVGAVDSDREVPSVPLCFLPPFKCYSVDSVLLKVAQGTSGRAHVHLGVGAISLRQRGRVGDASFWAVEA